MVEIEKAPVSRPGHLYVSNFENPSCRLASENLRQGGAERGLSKAMKESGEGLAMRELGTGTQRTWQEGAVSNLLGVLFVVKGKEQHPVQ